MLYSKKRKEKSLNDSKSLFNYSGFDAFKQILIDQNYSINVFI